MKSGRSVGCRWWGFAWCPPKVIQYAEATGGQPLSLSLTHTSVSYCAFTLSISLFYLSLSSCSLQVSLLRLRTMFICLSTILIQCDQIGRFLNFLGNKFETFGHTVIHLPTYIAHPLLSFISTLFSLSLYLFINSSDPCTRLSLSFLLSFFLFVSLLLPSLFLRSTPSERVRAGVNTDTSRYRVGQTFQPTK